MLFGTRTPLWRYVLGILSLSMVVHRIAMAVMAHLASVPMGLVIAYALQGLAGLIVALGPSRGAMSTAARLIRDSTCARVNLVRNKVFLTTPILPANREAAKSRCWSSVWAGPWPTRRI